MVRHQRSQRGVADTGTRDDRSGEDQQGDPSRPIIDARVVIRLRPILRGELANGEALCVSTTAAASSCPGRGGSTIKLARKFSGAVGQDSSTAGRHEYEESMTEFAIDQAIGPHVGNTEVYEIAAANLVDEAMDGGNGLLLLAGTPRSGRSHTLWGSSGIATVAAANGLLPLALEELARRWRRERNFKRFSQRQVSGSAMPATPFSSMVSDFVIKVCAAELGVKATRDLLGDGGVDQHNHGGIDGGDQQPSSSPTRWTMSARGVLAALASPGRSSDGARRSVSGVFEGVGKGGGGGGGRSGAALLTSRALDGVGEVTAGGVEEALDLIRESVERRRDGGHLVIAVKVLAGRGERGATAIVEEDTSVTGEIVFVEIGDCSGGSLPQVLRTALDHLQMKNLPTPSMNERQAGQSSPTPTVATTETPGTPTRKSNIPPASNETLWTLLDSLAGARKKRQAPQSSSDPNFSRPRNQAGSTDLSCRSFLGRTFFRRDASGESAGSTACPLAVTVVATLRSGDGDYADKKALLQEVGSRIPSRGTPWRNRPFQRMLVSMPSFTWRSSNASAPATSETAGESGGGGAMPSAPPIPSSEVSPNGSSSSSFLSGCFPASECVSSNVSSSSRAGSASERRSFSAIISPSGYPRSCNNGVLSPVPPSPPSPLPLSPTAVMPPLDTSENAVDVPAEPTSRARKVEADAADAVIPDDSPVTKTPSNQEGKRGGGARHAFKSEGDASDGNAEEVKRGGPGSSDGPLVSPVWDGSSRGILQSLGFLKLDPSELIDRLVQAEKSSEFWRVQHALMAEKLAELESNSQPKTDNTSNLSDERRAAAAEGRVEFASSDEEAKSRRFEREVEGSTVRRLFSVNTPPEQEIGNRIMAALAGGTGKSDGVDGRGRGDHSDDDDKVSDSQPRRHRDEIDVTELRQKVAEALRGLDGSSPDSSDMVEKFDRSKPSKVAQQLASEDALGAKDGCILDKDQRLQVPVLPFEQECALFFAKDTVSPDLECVDDSAAASMVTPQSLVRMKDWMSPVHLFSAAAVAAARESLKRKSAAFRVPPSDTADADAVTATGDLSTADPSATAGTDRDLLKDHQKSSTEDMDSVPMEERGRDQLHHEDAAEHGICHSSSEQSDMASFTPLQPAGAAAADNTALAPRLPRPRSRPLSPSSSPSRCHPHSKMLHDNALSPVATPGRRRCPAPCCHTGQSSDEAKYTSSKTLSAPGSPSLSSPPSFPKPKSAMRRARQGAAGADADCHPAGLTASAAEAASLAVASEVAKLPNLQRPETVSDFSVGHSVNDTTSEWYGIWERHGDPEQSGGGERWYTDGNLTPLGGQWGLSPTEETTGMESDDGRWFGGQREIDGAIDPSRGDSSGRRSGGIIASLAIGSPAPSSTAVALSSPTPESSEPSPLAPCEALIGRELDATYLTRRGARDPGVLQGIPQATFRAPSKTARVISTMARALAAAEPPREPSPPPATPPSWTGTALRQKSLRRQSDSPPVQRQRTRQWMHRRSSRASSSMSSVSFGYCASNELSAMGDNGTDFHYGRRAGRDDSRGPSNSGGNRSSLSAERGRPRIWRWPRGGVYHPMGQGYRHHGGGANDWKERPEGVGPWPLVDQSRESYSYRRSVIGAAGSGHSGRVPYGGSVHDIAPYDTGGYESGRYEYGGNNDSAYPHGRRAEARARAGKSSSSFQNREAQFRLRALTETMESTDTYRRNADWEGGIPHDLEGFMVEPRVYNGQGRTLRPSGFRLALPERWQAFPPQRAEWGDDCGGNWEGAEDGRRPW